MEGSVLYKKLTFLEPLRCSWFLNQAEAKGEDMYPVKHVKAPKNFITDYSKAVRSVVVPQRYHFIHVCFCLSIWSLEKQMSLTLPV